VEIEGEAQDPDRDRSGEGRESTDVTSALDDAFAQYRSDRLTEEER
jgi:hypothetical protein